jgi:hypothetical protein
MSYSVFTIWETYQADSGNNGYYVKHIGYFDTKEKAAAAQKDLFDEIQQKEAIKVGNDIWLLANGVGYNKPIEMK